MSDDSFDLVMPFVTVASKGGPHDDDSYVCGWEAAGLDVALTWLSGLGGRIEWTPDMPLHAANLPQVDLIAMRYGFTTEHHMPCGEEWAHLTFTRASGEPE